MAGFELRTSPPFTLADLDRADLIRKDAEAVSGRWADGRILEVDHRGRYAVDAGGALRWSAAVGRAESPVPGAVFLCLDPSDGVGLWAIRVEEITGPAGDPRVGPLSLSADEAGILAIALGLLNWQRTSAYSPVDGTPLESAEGGWVRVNPATGVEEYPRTDPAIIVVVHDGADRVLLGRQSVWPAGWYSTLAGFVEPGESLEQCVVREVFEESGVRVRSPRYLGSQPWPFPRSLMLGFEAVGDPSAPIVLADGELGDARWFHRDDVLAALDHADDWGVGDPVGPLMLPGAISISRSLIESWARAPR
ncbi:NAD(+) diphosphatase [Gordonia shandongensis]|uniref:NAD(+) diphosphatase n=1 Tax=Gordonia shandongensis TaxID=376351 RepID=UPI00041C9934|nr:NAD(+) diphosphatase [Gordonia shandongensis]